MLRYLTAIVCVAACGDNVPGLALGELEVALRQAHCSRDVRCGLFADDATCTSYFRRRPDLDLLAGIAHDTVRYDAVSAKSCVEALAELPCDQTSRDARVRPAACDRMFAGTVATGGACAFDEACVSGACKLPTCTSVEECCIGACRPSGVALGEACDASVECVPDAYCGDDAICHALEPMAGLCRADGDCAYGLACIGASDLMPGNCRAVGALGEMCLYRRCADVGARCTMAFSCVAIGLPGDSCEADADCSPYALCDAGAKTCIAVPALGAACTTVCAGEAFCDLGSARCTAPLENTAPCTSHDQCASLYCHQGPAFDQCRDPLVCD